MAKVVVLIPPAVPPGDPPINIRIIIENKLADFIEAMFNVANPAVRVVTDWKSEAMILSKKLKLPILLILLNSNKKIKSAPPRIKLIVIEMANLV